MHKINGHLHTFHKYDYFFYFFIFFSEEIDSSEVQFQISRNQTIYKGNFILKLVFQPID